MPKHSPRTRATPCPSTSAPSACLFDDRVTFRAEAAKVIGETRLSPDEVRWIVAVLVHGIPI